jgi:hypothetical protein
MPTRNAVSPHHQQQAASRLELLRQAVNIGMADIDAGRYKAFTTAEALRSHLQTLTAQAVRPA